MANNEGKGWFAILLGGSISYKTELSDYILDAILFAKESFSKDLISDILSFRLNMYEHDDDKLDFKLVKKNIRDFKEGKVEIKRIVESLEKVIPDDQIIIFLKKI
jgi:putative ATP-dependent endonuclease of OLD family